MAEYEIRFYALSRYAMVILPDEAEMIRRFMRGLTLRIKEAVFAVAQSGASLQRVVESAKEFELMHHEEYGDLRDKRFRTSGRFSSTSSGGKGSFRRDFRPQQGRPVQEAMQASDNGHSGRGSYGSGQASHGSSQRFSGRGGHTGYSGHAHQSMAPKSYYECGSSDHLWRDCLVYRQRGQQHGHQALARAAAPPTRGRGRSQGGRGTPPAGRRGGRGVT